MSDAQGYAAHLRLFGEDAGGVGGVVPADVEEVADMLLLEDVEQFGAFFGGRFVAAGTQCRGGGGGNLLKQLIGGGAQIDEIAFENAVDAVAGTENGANPVRGGTGFEDGAHEGLIDDHGGTARLGDEQGRSRHGGAGAGGEGRRRQKSRANMGSRGRRERMNQMVPLELGMPVSRGSGSTATRTARAKALNMLSVA